jgi:hypothetical protein
MNFCLENENCGKLIFLENKFKKDQFKNWRFISFLPVRSRTRLQ